MIHNKKEQSNETDDTDAHWSRIAGSLAFVGIAPAAAQAQQDGLVNVNVGDVTIAEDVNIGVAAQVAANLCDVKVGPVAVLGAAADRSEEGDTVCTTDAGAVTLEQN